MLVKFCVSGTCTVLCTAGDGILFTRTGREPVTPQVCSAATGGAPFTGKRSSFLHIHPFLTLFQRYFVPSYNQVFFMQRHLKCGDFQPRCCRIVQGLPPQRPLIDLPHALRNHFCHSFKESSWISTASLRYGSIVLCKPPQM